ncbi:MAG: 5-formyltetrahydrofolate cyclo-ligase [Pedosphaera sp.]|nr:5-formyltetrahydrofolate cyclo-ligase [Pedosphaera sp.]
MEGQPQPSDNPHLKAKAALRSRIRAELKKMSAAARADASLQACSLLEQQPLWQKAHSILFYAPLPEELDIWKLLVDSLAAGKTVSLPRFVPEQNAYVACHIKDHLEDIRHGQFGIREPNDSCSKISVNRLDLVLVPGVAFDLNGHRLGRGKGFYDQLLAVVQGPTCGIGFDQQLVREVPVEPHDVRLSCILTPTRWQSVAGPRAVLK